MSESALVPEDEQAAHLAMVQRRHASHVGTGSDRLQSRMDEIAAAAPAAQRGRLLHRAVTAQTVAQRVMWLRREADLVVEAARRASACSSGCAHCCHIPTLVSEPEAVEIGRATRREPATPPIGAAVRAADEEQHIRMTESLQARHFGAPCVFLRSDKTCAIYHVRPMACRYLINVDDDNLLCRLLPGQSVNVPYADSRLQRMAYVGAMGRNVWWADIRDWFPRV